MAEETKNVHEHEVPKVVAEESSAEKGEVKDRGLFDFLGKKKEETKPEETIDTEFEQKVHISEPAPEVKHEEQKEKEKKHSLLEKLHRNDSSSSSSSEEEGEDGEKRKKKKKDKKKSDEGEVKTEEEKKGFMEKLKEKLPGHGKKPEDASATAETTPAPPVVTPPVEEASHPAEKKGFLEKIKEKLPGYHPKNVEEEKKEKESD